MIVVLPALLCPTGRELDIKIRPFKNRVGTFLKAVQKYERRTGWQQDIKPLTPLTVKFF